MRIFTKLALAIGLALALAACSNAVTDADLEGLTPTEKVYVLKVDFKDKLSLVKRYAAQPPCSDTVVVGCADQQVLAALFDIAQEVDAALDTAEIAAANGEDPALQVALARAGYNRLVNQLIVQKLLTVDGSVQP